MKSSPVILISGSTERKGAEFDDLSLSLSLRYPLAIRAAGGIPWLLPCIPDRDFLAESVRGCDGVLLTGGDDVDPRLYARTKAPPHLQRTVHPAGPGRDLFELMLIDEVFRQRKPLLAICRGLQILNVALGGTLLLDIQSQVSGALNHSRTDRKDQLVHEVEIKHGTLLAEILGKDRIKVNSSHHQAAGNINLKLLKISAESIDGIVEGMELAPAKRHLLPYLLAVQFHPERLFARHADHRKLFASFLSASAAGDRRKL